MRILVLSTSVKKSVLSLCVAEALRHLGHQVSHPLVADVGSSLRDYEHVVVLLEDAGGPSLTKMLAMRAIGEHRHSLVYTPEFDPRWVWSSHSSLVYGVDLSNARKNFEKTISDALEHVDSAPPMLEPAFEWKRDTWDPTPWAPTESWDMINVKRGAHGLVGDPVSLNEIFGARAIMEMHNMSPWSWRLVAAAHLGVAYYRDPEWFDGQEAYLAQWSNDADYAEVARAQREEMLRWSTLSLDESAEKLTQVLLKDLKQVHV